MTSEKSVKTINSTVIKAHAGKKVQPTIPRAANDILVTAGEDQNKHMTKGVYANEFIKMAKDEYSDVVDEYEEEIDKQLSEEGIDLVEEVLHTDDELSDYGDTRDVQTGIYFPETFVEQMPARGKSQLITEAVEYYIKTPFLDRQHRIRVKREILQYERGEIEQEELSELAAEWIDVEFVPDSEDSQEDSDSEETEQTFRYDFPFEYEDHADDVKETQKQRISYLQEYIDCIADLYGYTDEDYPDNPEELIKTAERLFECSEASAKKYAAGVKVPVDEIHEEQKAQYTESEEFWDLVEDTKKWDSKTLHPSDFNYELLLENVSELEKHDIYLEHYLKDGYADRYKAVHDPDADDLHGSVVDTE